MKLISACKDIFNQLESVIEHITQEDFTKEVDTLNYSTIGQHIRHTLEFFTCLAHHHTQGIVNYDKRDHDRMIESDKTIAGALIKDLYNFIDQNPKDTQLVLEANYSMVNEEPISIGTTYFRELAYNIEHAIHHMAIIKIGLKEVAPYVPIPAHFGVAVSTIRYQDGTAC
ncbi:MAG: hypothetical protein MJA30_07335 [Cytophagales bacterium]|nr:hypothetical protein [Cytophagales bacterium]